MRDAFDFDKVAQLYGRYFADMAGITPRVDTPRHIPSDNMRFVAQTGSNVPLGKGEGAISAFNGGLADAYAVISEKEDPTAPGIPGNGDNSYGSFVLGTSPGPGTTTSYFLKFRQSIALH